MKLALSICSFFKTIGENQAWTVRAATVTV